VPRPLINKRYRVNEIFCSPQGEGHRQGEPSIFVRFTGCNLRCRVEAGPRSPGGFDCDTEFISGINMPAAELVTEVKHLSTQTDCKWIVLTGGEPTLQVDGYLCDLLHEQGFSLQIETNGTRGIPHAWGIDFITVSPKVAEHAIRQLTADEVKYVRGYKQGIPHTRVKAQHHFISPAFDGSEMDADAVRWCHQLAKENPPWKVSTQQHKLDGVR
jgi:7-carboxy-7-deazaguanine synthase